MAVLRTLTLNGTTYEVESSHATVHTVTLAADKWVYSGGMYSQVVDLPGITKQTKIDIQPTSDLLALLYLMSFGIYVENNEGVVTVIALGANPNMDIEVQFTASEVEVGA